MSSFNKSSETLKPKAPFALLRPYVAVLASLSVILGLIATAHVTSRQIPVSCLLLIPIVIGAFLGGLITEGLLLSGIGHWHRLSRLNAHGSLRRQQIPEQEIGRRQQLEELFIRSQRAVKSQLNEIESTYATAPVGLCFLDRDFRFVRINQRRAEIHGIPMEAHIGRSVQEVVPEIGLAIIPLLQRVIASGELIPKKEISGVMPNGSQIERSLQVSFFQ